MDSDLAAPQNGLREPAPCRTGRWVAKSSLFSQHKLVDYKHVCANTLVKTQGRDVDLPNLPRNVPRGESYYLYIGYQRMC